MFYEFDHPIVPDYFRKESDRDFTFTAHIHYCYELIVVHSGEMIVTVNNTEYTMHTGDAVLIFPNQIHSMKTPEHSSHTLFIFAPDLVSAYTKKIGEKIPMNNMFRPSAACLEMIKEITGGANLFEIKGLLYSLCACFHKNAEYVYSSTDSKTLLFRIFRFIQKNYGKNCTLSDLSQDTGYDYSYLSRYFKNIVGISFNDYVNKVRISHACYLITNVNMSILEISTECGFKSLRSLNRNFKEQVGVTPSEYRQNRLGSSRNV